ncbi:MAG TPA: acyl carrier protein [Verrucomicrobiae bacterium]|jgi:acyl carrier protein
MTHAEIHQKLTPIFRDVFDDPAIEIKDTMTAKDVPGWDSLTYVNLIVAVEKAFAVSFTTKEVKSLVNVGALIELLAKRTA